MAKLQRYGVSSPFKVKSDDGVFVLSEDVEVMEEDYEQVCEVVRSFCEVCFPKGDICTDCCLRGRHPETGKLPEGTEVAKIADKLVIHELLNRDDVTMRVRTITENSGVIKVEGVLGNGVAFHFDKNGKLTTFEVCEK